MTNPPAVPYTPSTAKWPHNAFDEIEVIERRSRHLRCMARAFVTLRQDALANDMLDIAEELDAAAKSMHNIVGECTFRQLKDAEQSTANMLGAVMAMAAMAKAS